MQLIEICLIGAGALLLGLAAYLGKRQADQAELPARKPPPASLSPENAANLQTSLTQLLNELHTLSRDMTVDLEQKLAELKQLLQLADMTLEEMSPAGVQEQLLEDPAIEMQTSKQESVESPEPELQVTVEDEQIPTPAADRYQEIYKMAEKGLTVDEIARRMEMGKGEIQLILSLRKKD